MRDDLFILLYEFIIDVLCVAIGIYFLIDTPKILFGVMAFAGFAKPWPKFN